MAAQNGICDVRVNLDMRIVLHNRYAFLVYVCHTIGGD